MSWRSHSPLSRLLPPSHDATRPHTKVLQGHIATDSAVFLKAPLARSSTSSPGKRCGARVKLRRAPSAPFLTVHEGSHGFGSDVPLVPGIKWWPVGLPWTLLSLYQLIALLY
uniref:Uncharacterized protein n=1 Tax=Mycena chlorophos TaxID=658473 RepID=A0ABQ0LAE2_MYCCL|nr:predicted protein [Mycena chlorophos]